MGLVKRKIGRTVVNLGEYDSERLTGYDATNRCYLYGCEWESLIEGNTYPPATLVDGEVVPDTEHWKLAAGNPAAYGIENKVSAKYTKPSGGIPKTDLTQAVQDSLNLADTALQSHQDISGKANKNEMSITPGTGANADKTTIQLKSGTSAVVITQHQDISGKANNASTLAGYGIGDAYTKSEVNELVSTPRQEYETVEATQNTSSVEELLPVTGSADTIYRVANWNGSEYNRTCYTEYTWNGSTYIPLSVKTIGVDSEAIEESENFITSGGAYKIKQHSIQNESNNSQLRTLLQTSIEQGFIDEGSVIDNANFRIYTYNVNGGTKYLFSGNVSPNVYGFHFIYWFDANDQPISGSLFIKSNNGAEKDIVVVAPITARKAKISIQKAFISSLVFKEVGEVILSQTLADGIKIADSFTSRKSLMTPVAITQNSFIDDDGSVKSLVNFAILKYAVESLGIYSFSEYHSELVNIPFLSWLDSNGSVISIENTIFTNVTYKDKVVIAPPGAVYAALNTQTSHDKVANMKKVENDKIDFMSMQNELPSCDLNDVRNTGTWLLVDSNEYSNTPENKNIGFLRVSSVAEWILQEFYSFSTAKLFKRKFRESASSVENWSVAGGGGAENNYTFNEYSQTVNIDATPSITADSNNYLSSTNDETDRTADILTMLQATGICRLGPGVFYVDCIIMPDDSSIIGSGASTRVFLKEGENKFAFKPGTRCMIKDMKILGASSLTPSSNIGTRHGILWQGNYTQEHDSNLQPVATILDGLYIAAFSGGGITCYDTGYGTTNHIFASNCYIWSCGAGINISYLSEFHKFTNVHCSGCYYGCINNGGNNIFVNCDFSSSRGIAFLMDNDQNQSPNNSHGSCVACVFNHTASNTGIGIKVLNCNNGFVFDGCQIFYSQIYIKDSAGICVSACNLGNTNCDIEVNGGGVILFSNNMFEATPPITITNNNQVHFVNCYNHTTGELVNN